jgi:hypothetical protein
MRGPPLAALLGAKMPLCLRRFFVVVIKKNNRAKQNASRGDGIGHDLFEMDGCCCFWGALLFLGRSGRLANFFATGGGRGGK